MKNFIVKIKTDSNILETTNIITKDNIVTRVKGRAGVVYELCVNNEYNSPGHLITTRVNQNLHIVLEGNGKKTDLIIEEYFDFPESYLIGQAEDGNYYHYIPDTGEQFDYVNNLASGEIEGHALGGNPLTTSWWGGQASIEEFDFNPLLLLPPIASATAVTLLLDTDKDDVKVDTLGQEVVIDFNSVETLVLETSENIELSLADVLEITENDKLFIDGNDSNSIMLTGFTESANISSDSHNGYNLYTNNDVNLYIDQNIYIL